MSLKQITFKEALVILARGGKIYHDPEEHKNYPPIYLDDKERIMNAGYMELIDFPHVKWFAEV